MYKKPVAAKPTRSMKAATEVVKTLVRSRERKLERTASHHETALVTDCVHCNCRSPAVERSYRNKSKAI